jgi:hypothetical protein
MPGARPEPAAGRTRIRQKMSCFVMLRIRVGKALRAVATRHFRQLIFPRLRRKLDQHLAKLAGSPDLLRKGEARTEGAGAKVHAIGIAARRPPVAIGHAV